MMMTWLKRAGAFISAVLVLFFAWRTLRNTRVSNEAGIESEREEAKGRIEEALDLRTKRVELRDKAKRNAQRANKQIQRIKEADHDLAILANDANRRARERVL